MPGIRKKPQPTTNPATSESLAHPNKKLIRLRASSAPSADKTSPSRPRRSAPPIDVSVSKSSLKINESANAKTPNMPRIPHASGSLKIRSTIEVSSGKEQPPQKRAHQNNLFNINRFDAKGTAAL